MIFRPTPWTDFKDITKHVHHPLICDVIYEILFTHILSGHLNERQLVGLHCQTHIYNMYSMRFGKSCIPIKGYNFIKSMVVFIQHWPVFCAC